MPEPSVTQTSPQYVPYQAYKPKRHSRNFSNPNPPSSPSAVVSPATSPLPKVHSSEDKESLASFSLAGSYGSLPSVGPSTLKPQLAVFPPTMRVEQSLDFYETERPVPTTAKSSLSLHELTPTGNSEDHEGDRPKSATVPTQLGLSLSSSTPPSPSTSQSPNKVPSSSVPRKISTFRRLAPRTTHPASTSSPLVPPSSSIHNRNTSTSSLPVQPRPSPFHSELTTVSHPALQANQRSRTSSALSAPLISPRLSEQHLPKDSVVNTEGRNIHPPDPRPLENRTHSSQTSSISIAKSNSSSVQNGSESSKSGIPSPPNPATQKAKSAPYPLGFQPKGVCRQLTDGFLSIRRLKKDGEGETGRAKRIERTKLERRLEKLVALHFPSARSDEKDAASPAGPRAQVGGTIRRRTSSFFDFESMKNLKLGDPSDLWRGVVGTHDAGKQDIRAAEQRITPWEEDNTVNKCPLCQASFHPLTNRKHHCRLCGRIVCSLPPKPPQRNVTCSLLFVVDTTARRIEEVGEGVDYGVRKKVGPSANRQAEEEKFLKGVRICRDCRPTILRQQYRQEEDVPIFVRLYEVLMSLEKEIEDSLPQFQELLLSLSHNDQPTKEASVARKRLLEAFAQYDKLSKQIRALPCINGAGSSQDRIQMAILSRANQFLQKNMFPLQALPKSSVVKSMDFSKQLNGLNKNGEDGDPVIDPDSVLARTLQPLLEQESLLESFIEEARAQRKFEDVKTLKLNHEEIRREIERVLDGSGLAGRSADSNTQTARNGH